MRRTIITFAMALGLLLAACEGGQGQVYEEACKANTPEAYRGYIEQFPEGMHISDVKHRLDELEYGMAEDAGTAAAYEDYLEKHPDGVHATEAMDKAKSAAWDEAELANTVEAMVAYKEKYGQGAAGIRVDKRLDALRYAVTSVKIEEVAVERINVGGDEKADPNGYEVTARVTNAGEKDMAVCKVRVAFLDDKNDVVGHRLDFVATPSHPMGLPLPDEVKQPLKAGEDRAFRYLIGDDNVPEGAVVDVAHVRVEVTEIEFAG